MTSSIFQKRVELGASPSTVLDWHSRPGALERLIPPWESVTLESRTGGLDSGQVRLRTRVGPFRPLWVAEHRSLADELAFQDVQVRGPFARWEHTHRIRPTAGGCALEDHVEYRLPGGWLGSLVAGASVARRLERMFAYRHRVLRDDIQRHQTEEEIAMRVMVTGATGLVGSSLTSFLSSGGHDVRKLVRGAAPDAGDRSWNPAAGALQPAAFDEVDAVVHLAGENIAAGRWSARQKERILSSRVEGTALLARTLANHPTPPHTLVCASAVGIYGSRAAELLDEESSRGDGFLAEVCAAWEEAARPAVEAGIRVVHLRFGVILSAAGGALRKMLTPFRLGLGGRVGSGEQYMSWIALDDAVAAIHHALTSEALRGPVNAVAPNPATNAEFTKTLGRVLRRPTLFPMPAFAARLAFGEMGDELLLASQRVRPAALEASGFRFAYPDLEGALRHVLGR